MGLSRARLTCLAFVLPAIATSQTIHAGDVLSVECADDPTWSVRRVVAPNGSIDLPIVGPLLVGPDLAEARRTILAKLSPYAGGLDVRLCGTRRSGIEVAGSCPSIDWPYSRGLDLLDLLALACDRAPSRVIVTDAFGRSVTLDLTRKASYPLRAGDRVLVLTDDQVADILVVGAVQRPGALQIQGETKLSEALDRVGGTALDADESTLSIQAPGGVPHAARLDEVLAAGSIVRISRHRSAGLVIVGGSVRLAGPYRVRPGIGLLALLRRAGWPAVEGTMTCTIGHLRSGRIESATLDLRDLLAGKIVEPTILPGDSIVVGP